MSLFTEADVADFKADCLMAAMSEYFPAPGGGCSRGSPSDKALLRQLHAAEAEVAHSLNVFLEPTTVFPYEPTEEEVAALQGQPWAEEPGYDYDPDFFQADSWGYLVLRQKPIISIEYVRLAYPSPAQQFFAIPHDWLRPDKKYGTIRMVPASQSFNAPLGAFIMQALGGGRGVPSMIQVKYVAGLKDAKTDPKWADLIDVIYKLATLKVLNGLFRAQSESISADGLSQSRSFDGSKHREMIDEALFGPKGSNGGLNRAIHGVGSTIAGALA